MASETRPLITQKSKRQPAVQNSYKPWTGPNSNACNSCYFFIPFLSRSYFTPNKIEKLFYFSFKFYNPETSMSTAGKKYLTQKVGFLDHNSMALV